MMQSLYPLYQTASSLFPDRPMDILTRLYRLPTGRFHYTLLGLIGVGWLFDAMDTGLVSFVLPTLSQQWQLTPAQSGWIVSVAFVGMALGAVASGWAADRFGWDGGFRVMVVGGVIAIILLLITTIEEGRHKAKIPEQERLVK